VPRRVHLAAAAARGNAAARAALAGPDCPDALRHVLEWARELHGRSGVGMAGLAPLAYGTIADWARLTGRRPRPHEVEALITLDAVLRHPEAGPDGDGEE
jgi:hypothetical protein